MAELRPWKVSDAVALLSALSSTPDLVTQFGPAQPQTEAEAAEFITKNLGAGPTWQNWAISWRGKAVGNIGISAIEHRHQTGWAYYWLAAEARGHGFARSALATAASWAFAAGVYRLELGHRVNNPASCAVATAAGFIAEGIEREKLSYDGQRYDVETHARLATDPAPDMPLLSVA